MLKKTSCRGLGGQTNLYGAKPPARPPKRTWAGAYRMHEKALRPRTSLAAFFSICLNDGESKPDDFCQYIARLGELSNKNPARRNELDLKPTFLYFHV